MLQPTSALVGYFNERGLGDKIPPFATDGRFSGGSTGVLVAHLPDAYKLGSITSLIDNDDFISIDLNNNTINVDVDPNQLLARKQIVYPKNPKLNGYLSKFNRLVSNLESGYLT